MEDLIHIDEKWFYLTKDGQCFIIAADEEEPYRHEEKCMVQQEDWNLAYQEMGAGKEVIKEARKGNACVEEPMHYMGCLS